MDKKLQRKYLNYVESANVPNSSKKKKQNHKTKNLINIFEAHLAVFAYAYQGLSVVQGWLLYLFI